MGQPPQIRGDLCHRIGGRYLRFANVSSRGYANSYYAAGVDSMLQSWHNFFLATGRPVLYLGGFMGQDEVVTPEHLSRMLAEGDLRFIYWSSNGDGTRGFGAQSSISSWVAANCVSVNGFDTLTRNAGAPGGTSATPASGTGPGGFGWMRISL